VAFELGGMDEPLLVVPEVIVVPGRETRLEDVDMREVFHAFELLIHGDDEDRKLRGRVQVGPVGSSDLSVQRWLRGTRITLHMPWSAIDADVHVAGFRTAELRGLEGDAEVTLEPGFPVRVRLVGDATLPEAPYGLSVSLVPAEQGQYVTDMHGQRFDARREVLLRSSYAGAVRLKWIVESSSSSGGTVKSVDPEPEQLIHLTASSAEQLVQVHLSKEELERLLARVTD
jgi:hypothetical protein